MSPQALIYTFDVAPGPQWSTEYINYKELIEDFETMLIKGGVS